MCAIYWRQLDLISHFNTDLFSFTVLSNYHTVTWKISLLLTPVSLQIASFLLSALRFGKELRWRGDAESVTLPKATIDLCFMMQVSLNKKEISYLLCAPCSQLVTSTFFFPVGITSSGFRKLLLLAVCISLYIFHSSAMLLSQVLGSSVSVWSSDK